MKFKKIILPLFLTIVFFITSNSVQALEKPYYINNNGVEMTKEQYDKLVDRFNENIVASMPQENFDFEINHEVEIKNTETKYFMETTMYDVTGESINSISKEITEEEYLNRKDNTSNISTRGSVALETTMKYLKLDTYKYANSTTATITVRLSWSSIPKTKSYDVIAARWTMNSGASFNNISYYGMQLVNPESTNQESQIYSQGGSNSVQTNNGVGISMNIFDNAQHELNNDLYISGTLTGNGQVSAAYQHATKNVTLAQSKSYSFSANGLGGVLYYSNATIRGYYDGMGGVKTTF